MQYVNNINLSSTEALILYFSFNIAHISGFVIPTYLFSSSSAYTLFPLLQAVIMILYNSSRLIWKDPAAILMGA